MKTAIQLAKKGLGRVSPNPMAGAVLVQGSDIIGKGYHHFFGGPHAEINALNSAKQKAQGADLYVNLEPCSHFGKTPPCADALIAQGIRRVFIGIQDPNPKVSGRGIKKLQQAGIQVEVGILEQECRRLNESFIKFITYHVPFVILKTAATLDGKIASHTGDSKWITCEESRKFVHQLRSGVDAVLIGIGTVLHDDPLLTARFPKRAKKQPSRIIVDSSLRIPLTSRILKTSRAINTFMVTAQKGSLRKSEAVKKLGAQILSVPSKCGRVDLKKLMQVLGQMDIASVLIEGGSEISAAALHDGIVDKIVFFYAPKILGGKNAVSMVGGQGFKRIKSAILVNEMKFRMIEGDLLIEGYINKHVYRNN